MNPFDQPPEGGVYKTLPSVSPSLIKSTHPSLFPSRTLPSAEPSTTSPIITSLAPTMPWKDDHINADDVPNDSGKKQPSFAPTSSIPQQNNDDKFIDEVWVRSVKLKLSLISRLARRFNHVDILGFERIVGTICKDCYASEECYRNDGGGGGGSNTDEVKDDRRRRHLQDQQGRRRDARDVIQTSVVFVRQDIVYDDNNMPVNIIVYDQHFVFNTKPEAGKQNDDDNSNNNGDVELYTPPELTKLPFNETAWNMRLGTELQAKVQALQDVKLPLDVPDVPDQAQFLLKSGDNDGKNGLSQGAIGGIFAAAAFAFTGIAIYGLRQLDLANASG